MGRGKDVCIHGTETVRKPDSTHFNSECGWHVAGWCPHPRACDNQKRCIHALDSHDVWQELNHGG